MLGGILHRLKVSFSHDPIVLDFNILDNGNASSKFENVAYNDAKKNYTVCAWGKENAGTPHPADIEILNGDSVFVVHAGDCVSSGDASAWDNQFWIQAPLELHSGDEVLVFFEYKASQPALVSTQVHKQTPSDYLYWQGLGDLNFTTEWKRFYYPVTITEEQHGMWSFAFNLNAKVKSATDFYFRKLQIQVLNDLGTEIVNNPKNLLQNGNANEDFDENIAFDDPVKNKTVCAWGKFNAENPKPAKVLIDYFYNGWANRCFALYTGDCVTEGEASAWDNQFWIQAPREFHTGDVVRISFDYRFACNSFQIADIEKARVSTQVHGQTPSNYLHWEGIGDLIFEKDWKRFDKEFTVNEQQNGMWSIAFNLNEEIKHAMVFYFDHLTWELVKEATAINEIHSDEIRSEQRYNLKGQRVGDGQKGLIIQGGKIRLVK